MLYTGAVTLSPQILVLMVRSMTDGGKRMRNRRRHLDFFPLFQFALGCIFEWVLRYGEIEDSYLIPEHHEYHEAHGHHG